MLSMSKDIDIELPERIDEIIIRGKDQGKMKITIKCAHCMNGRHHDCIGVGCECKRNNHLQN